MKKQQNTRSPGFQNRQIPDVNTTGPEASCWFKIFNLQDFTGEYRLLFMLV